MLLGYLEQMEAESKMTEEIETLRDKYGEHLNYLNKVESIGKHAEALGATAEKTKKRTNVDVLTRRREDLGEALAIAQEESAMDLEGIIVYTRNNKQPIITGARELVADEIGRVYSITPQEIPGNVEHEKRNKLLNRAREYTQALQDQDHSKLEALVEKRIEGVAEEIREKVEEPFKEEEYKDFNKDKIKNYVEVIAGIAARDTARRYREEPTLIVAEAQQEFFSAFAEETKDKEGKTVRKVNKQAIAEYAALNLGRAYALAEAETDAAKKDRAYGAIAEQVFRIAQRKKEKKE